jgi:hypothetical protein
MVTADPARTPTLTMFANPDYFLFTGGTSCATPCVQEEPGFAWNHGDVAPDINTTWLGLVGPGVKHLGVEHSVWSDHTDVRPTMMELLRLHDDYQHEGRVLFEMLKPSALPVAVRQRLGELMALGTLLKQIDAPVGELGLTTLAISTRALESSSPNDRTYTSLENELLTITQTRNALVSQILSLLETAEFGAASHGVHANSQPAISSLMAQARSLLKQAATAAQA